MLYTPVCTNKLLFGSGHHQSPEDGLPDIGQPLLKVNLFYTEFCNHVGFDSGLCFE